MTNQPAVFDLEAIKAELTEALERGANDRMSLHHRHLRWVFCTTSAPNLIAEVVALAADRDRLLTVNELLAALLQEALPHVEQMANELATGPVAGPVEKLVGAMEAAILAALAEARKP